MNKQMIEEIVERQSQALNRVSSLAAGERFRTTIPASESDDDVVIGNSLYDINALFKHIDAMEAEHNAAMQRAIDDAFRQAEVTTKFIDEQTARITELQNTVVNLRKELDFDHEQETERINQMWALVYPDDPTGWEYWAQCWRHVRDLIDEQRQEIAALKSEKANERGG